MNLVLNINYITQAWQSKLSLKVKKKFLTVMVDKFTIIIKTNHHISYQPIKHEKRYKHFLQQSRSYILERIRCIAYNFNYIKRKLYERVKYEYRFSHDEDTIYYTNRHFYFYQTKTIVRQQINISPLPYQSIRTHYSDYQPRISFYCPMGVQKLVHAASTQSEIHTRFLSCQAYTLTIKLWTSYEQYFLKFIGVTL